MFSHVEIAKPSQKFEPCIICYRNIESDVTGLLRSVPPSYIELGFSFTKAKYISPGYFYMNNPQKVLQGLQQYDQSHFTRKIKKVTGITPGDLKHHDSEIRKDAYPRQFFLEQIS